MLLRLNPSMWAIIDFSPVFGNRLLLFYNIQPLCWQYTTNIKQAYFGMVLAHVWMQTKCVLQFVRCVGLPYFDDQLEELEI